MARAQKKTTWLKLTKTEFQRSQNLFELAITKYIPLVSPYLFSMDFTTKRFNLNLDHGVTMNRSINLYVELPNLIFKSSPFIIVQKPEPWGNPFILHLFLWQYQFSLMFHPHIPQFSHGRSLRMSSYYCYLK